MKKKLVLAILMTMTVSSVFAGCGNIKTSVISDPATEQSTEKTKSGLALITDWETKANITLGKTISVDGEGAKVSDKVIKITEGGAYTISGESQDASILVDTEEDVKLILDGVTMTSTSGPVIYGKQAKSLYVETTEGSENTLTDSSDYETDEDGKSVGKAVVSSKDDLVLLGKGTLTLNGNYKHCIAGNDSVYFEGGTYQLSTTAKDGVHANDLIAVDDGTFTIDAVSDCMESEGDLIINGGTITGNSDDEGLEGKEKLTINDGTIDLQVVDDGLNAGSAILIKDGEITIHTSQGDAIDSNGSLQVDGGTITAYGGSVPEGGLDCDNAQVVINGGTIVVAGDVNSSISEDSKQVSVLLGQYQKGDTISITTESGEEVLGFTLEDAKSNIVVSSPKFTQGETYKVLVNGEEDQSFTVDSTVISAGGTADAMGGGPGGQMLQGEKPQGQPGDGQMQPGGDGQKERPSGQPPQGEKDNSAEKSEENN